MKIRYQYKVYPNCDRATTYSEFANRNMVPAAVIAFCWLSGFSVYFAYLVCDLFLYGYAGSELLEAALGLILGLALSWWAFCEKPIRAEHKPDIIVLQCSCKDEPYERNRKIASIKNAMKEERKASLPKYVYSCALFVTALFSITGIYNGFVEQSAALLIVSILFLIASIIITVLTFKKVFDL